MTEDRPVEELLAEVEVRAKVCTSCGLAATRTNVVFGEGNPKSPLVIIGEGPGEHEDATGRPFVGRAGALLDKALREAGMSRRHVYICNIVKCRASFEQDGRLRNRPPAPEEIQACNKWLDAQLSIIRPLVVVCLGAPAASAVIQKNFKISQDRGKWFSCRWTPAAIAAFHPAYILRNAGETYNATYRTLVNDLLEARKKVIELKNSEEQQKPVVPPDQEQMSLF